MAIEHKCPNCGFSYEVRMDDKKAESCPNCGTPQKKPEGQDETMQ